MKTIILCCFLSIFIVKQSFTQVHSWNNFCNALKASNLKLPQLERLNMPSQNASKREPIVNNRVYTRKFHKNYVQTYYSIPRNTNQEQSKDYVLNVLSKDGKIIWLELKEENLATSEILIKKPSFEQLLKEMQKDLGINPDPNHKYFNPSRQIFVGFTCNTYEKESLELMHLVYTKNKKEILKWCSSINPEIRCYGIIGLSILKEEGTPLNAEEKHLLRKLKFDRTLVFRCLNLCYSEEEGAFLSTVGDTFSLEKQRYRYKKRAERA